MRFRSGHFLGGFAWWRLSVAKRQTAQAGFEIKLKT